MCLYFNDLYIPDIDECLENTDLCEHDCYNTHGSYVCDCEPGYKIDENDFFCSGKLVVLTNIILVIINIQFSFSPIVIML